MSYCRFSDDNWRSDVYAYESSDGYEVHIAGNRVVGDIPARPSIGDIPYLAPGEFLRAHQAQHEFLETAERVPIGGPHDGEHYLYSTLQELRDGLKGLQADGYHVPAFVFEEIEAEMAEEAS